MYDTPKKSTQTIYTYDLEAGTLTLVTSPTRGREMFRVAERINPKRAFLFVSTVLGRHIPVYPAEHRAILKQLAKGVTAHLLDGPVFVMGFAETAVGIGAGVFDCLRTAHGGRDMGYLTTTRFTPSKASDWFVIEENHSHAVDHIILHPNVDVVQQGVDATLVLVDDETTTGKTFSALAKGLRENGLVFDRVILVTLTDWSDGRAKEAVLGIFEEADVCCVSLEQGNWTWTPKDDWLHSGLPGKCVVQCPTWIPDAEQSFAAPRFGIASSQARQTGEDILTIIEAAGFIPACKDDKVLVVGAGEHVWQPMLAAEALSARGIDISFITTTRSPILKGETIRNKFSFPDHYGQGFWMYIHNISPVDWDRIVLFTETSADGVPEAFVEWVGQVDVIDGNGIVTVLTAKEVSE